MRGALDARIIWRADLDPATIVVDAVGSSDNDPEAIDPAELDPWLTVATDKEGREYAVVSDGIHHLRLDVASGSLAAPGPVVLHYRLQGIEAAARLLGPMRRLLDFWRTRRFRAPLYPRDPRIARGLVLLRVSDALADGASQREIAVALYGNDRVDNDWRGASEAMRSQVRRLVADARAMAAGSYRDLLRGGASPG